MLHDSSRPLATLSFHRLFSQLRPAELIDRWLRPLGELRGPVEAPPDDWLPDRVLTQLEWDGRLKDSAAAVKSRLERRFDQDRRGLLAKLGSADRLTELFDDEAHVKPGPTHRRGAHGYSVAPGTGDRLLAAPPLKYAFVRDGDAWRATPPAVEEIAQQALLLPEGRRIFRSYDFHYVFPDRIETGDEQPTHEQGRVWDGHWPDTPPHQERRFPGVFFARWRQEIVPRWREYFTALRERGVALNGLLLDWERQLSFHSISKQRDQHGRSGVLAWLATHPDWPPLAERFRLNLAGSDRWRGDSPAAQRFTEAMHVHQAEQMQLLHDTLRDLFGPAFRLMSNYNHFLKCATYQSGGPQTYAYSPPGCGAILGNCQSVPIYNSINASWKPGVPARPMQAASYSVGVTGARDGSAWDRFLYDQFSLRRIAAASHQPLAPYVANLEYAVKPDAAPAERPLWHEQIRCAACLGADPILYWDQTHGNSPATGAALEQLLAEIETMFDGQHGTPRTPERINWDEQTAVVCTIELPGRLLSRFVPHPAEREAFDRQARDQTLTLRHKPSGRTWSFPRGRMLPAEKSYAGQAAAPGVGWWIEQPNRTQADRDLWQTECRTAAWQVLMPEGPE